MSLDYLNKLLFKDTSSTLKTSSLEREVSSEKQGIFTQPFSEVYLQENKSSFASQVRGGSQHVRESKSMTSKKQVLMDKKSDGQNLHKGQDAKVEDNQRRNQYVHRHTVGQHKNHYVNFSQMDFENVENQNPQFFYLPDVTDLIAEKNEVLILPYEIFGADILISPEIISPQESMLKSLQLVPEQNGNSDMLLNERMSEEILEDAQHTEDIQLNQPHLQVQTGDRFKKVVTTSQLMSDQEGLLSLKVKDLPLALSSLNHSIMQQMPYLSSMFENVAEAHIASNDALSEVDDSSDLQSHIFLKGKDPTALNVGHTYETDAVKDVAGKGSKDSGLNFMQEQQQVASTTITENITVIESLSNQMKSRLKKEPDIKNSVIDFDIKHKDLGELSVSLKIQDGHVDALFKGESYEFRNLLRQNLSSISKIFQDLDLKCQVQAINIIKK